MASLPDLHDRTGGLEAEGDGQPSPAETPIDRARIEHAVREILSAVGEDPNREGLRETPARRFPPRPTRQHCHNATGSPA